MTQILPPSAATEDDAVGEMYGIVAGAVGAFFVELAGLGVATVAGSYLCDRPWSAAAAYVTGRVGCALWREASQEIAQRENSENPGAFTYDEECEAATQPYHWMRTAAAVLCTVAFGVGASLAKDTWGRFSADAPAKVVAAPVARLRLG